MQEEEDWESLQIFVDAMKDTSSVLEKKGLLQQVGTFVQKILSCTYDPYRKYNVTSRQCRKHSHLKAYDDVGTFFRLLDDLDARVITGHDAVHAVNAYINKNIKYENVIFSVIDRNLQIRASDAIINAVFPGLIPVFEVALAHSYEQKLCDFSKEVWFASRKLDGVRCIVRKTGDTVTAYSRQGHEFTTLGKITEEVSKICGDFVLDGEVCIMDGEGNEDFQSVMKEIRRKSHTIDNPTYIVFDHLSIDEFDRRASTRTLSRRLSSAVLHNSECISRLSQTRVESNEHLSSLLKIADDSGFEGVMLRRDVPYEGKRTKHLLKCKTFFDDEYVVTRVDFEDHRIIEDGREIKVPMLAQVWIEHKGFEVAVGSGWTQQQRRHYQEYPEELVGKIITVKYFEETTNKDGRISLRFPTVKSVHGETRAT